MSVSGTIPSKSYERLESQTRMHNMKTLPQGQVYSPLTLQMEACHRFPLGVIPTGRTNTVARRLYFTEKMRLQQLAAEGAMALIKDVKKPMDAFRVDFHDEKLWERNEDEAESRLKAIHDQDLMVKPLDGKVGAEGNR